MSKFVKLAAEPRLFSFEWWSKNALKLFKYRPKSFSRYKKFIPGYKGVKISLIYKWYEGVVSVGGLDESRPYYLEEVNLKLLNMVV